jgi:RNA polymerase sigma factor (sigma-70 family)
MLKRIKKQKEFSDGELIEALRNRLQTERALEFIYAKHYRLMELIVTNTGGSKTEAEDVIQEAIISFMQMVTRGQFRGEAKVSTVLYSITRNLWITELRKQNSREARDAAFNLQQQKEGMDLAETVTRREAHQQVMDVFEQLGQDCKKLLTLFYYHELSMKEMMKQFEFGSEQALRNKKHKCMTSLLALIKKYPHVKNQLKTALQHGTTH